MPSMSSDSDTPHSPASLSRRHVHFHSDESSSGPAAPLLRRSTSHPSDTDTTPVFTPSDPNASLNATFASRPHPLVNPNGRHLMDLYGDSLRHVNHLFNAKYGKESRKAPAHMPHCINRVVMSELQQRWQDQYDVTSSHRFRDARDMQMAFSYYYYVMNEPAPFDLNQLWTDKLDWDGDGYLSDEEVRLMALYMTGAKTIDDSDLLTLRQHLHNHTTTTTHHRITLDTLHRTTDIVSALSARHKLTKKYRHEVMTTQDTVQFYMVSDNATRVRQRLDELRVQQPKFLCLNDNMALNDSDPHSGRESAAVLREFYESYFPRRCPFEVPEGERNEFQYVDEWSGRKYGSGAGWVGGVSSWWSSAVGWVLWMCVAVVCGALVGVMCWWWCRRRSSNVGGVLDRRRMLMSDSRSTSHAHPRTSTIV